MITAGRPFHNRTATAGQRTTDRRRPQNASRNNCNAIIKKSTNELIQGCKNTIIPNTVTSIGDYAFDYCSGLTSIDIPSSVTSIGDYAFGYCSSLTSITVDPENPNYDSRNNCNAIIKKSTNELIQGCKNTIIPNTVTSIGNYAFYTCSSLTSIDIPSSVTSIGDYAFGCCSGLTSIDIPSSVTSIGSNAFYNCSGLSSIEFQSGVKTIHNNAFYYCSSLTSINIPSSVTSIGSMVFSYCKGLTSITVDPENPNYDSRNNCNAIIKKSTNELIQGCKNTIIPNTVTSIGSNAFYDCSGLTSIDIPSNVTSIGDYAFRYCSGLKGISIPSSVTSCESHILEECRSLTKVVNNSDCNISLGYTGGGWKKGSLDGEDIYSIKNGTAVRKLSGGTEPENPDEPDDEITVGDFTFEINGDEAVLIKINSEGGSIDIPSSVEYDGKTYTVTTIDDIDENTKEFTTPATITIPASVKKINDGAFIGAKGLKSVSFLGSTAELGSQVFDDCPDLESVTLPKGLTVIPDELFNECLKLTSLSIPGTVTKIGKDAFCSTGLKSIKIPGSVKVIGEGAFSCCDALTGITISKGVEEIEKQAFWGSPDKAVLHIPVSVKKMGEEALGHDSQEAEEVNGEWEWISKKRYHVIYAGTEKQWKAIEGIDKCGLFVSDRITFSGTVSENKDSNNNDPNNKEENGGENNDPNNKEENGGENKDPATPKDPSELGNGSNANDVTDAFSSFHNNDGTKAEAGTVSSGNAEWIFDPEKSETVVVVKKLNISNRLESFKKAEGYVESAKHRYKLDEKGIAKINNKGVLQPKKNGEINIKLEQKVKGGSWTEIGSPVHIYIQLPAMQKNETMTVTAESTIDAFKYLSHTTYRPTEWKSSKPKVASVDPKTGIITVHKKGSVKIIAVYGKGKESSGKKCATELKIKIG